VLCDEEAHALGAGHLLFVFFIHNAEHFGWGGWDKIGVTPQLFSEIFLQKAASVET
jgi:hypothetical protein